MLENKPVFNILKERFLDAIIGSQETCDKITTVWISPVKNQEILAFLQKEIPEPFMVLYDITAIDERSRERREGQPPATFTVVYHLISYDRNQDIRVKVPLTEEFPRLRSVTKLWPNANWYEREVYDMFGIIFEGHPLLKRILMPPTWVGHPLRKEHPARATEMGPFQLTNERQDYEQNALTFKPEEWGLSRETEDEEFMFLNLGPQHPGTHGVIRLVLQLRGEEIVNCIPDIGFHHRGAEKMGERQTWHTFIPYTDRIDYLGGVMNNLAYLLAVEQMVGLKVPPRAQMIRVMMSELFRIASHLVWYGTFAQDVGAMSAVFYMFNDREKIFRIVEGICGGRMHPSWFRIGGVAHDLPNGWDKPIREFLNYLPKRLKEYDTLVMGNTIFKARTVGVGAYSQQEALNWGITGAGLRATGFAWDFRKQRPYSGYEQFDFEVPTAINGDCYARAQVRIEEMRQSLRIIKQCVDNMPSGDYKSHDPRTTPPVKNNTMQDIETLINHFLNVTWGPVMPATESFHGIEATKGNNGYYLISDGGTRSYRTRIRTPSFAHLQMVPLLSQGASVADLLAILGSIDYVLADLDR
jgi:NADH-quinone oxidoreductase subunit C/D